MNTFFTVWFLVSGVWYANYFDGWDAYDRKTTANCKESVMFATAHDSDSRSTVKTQYTCESDSLPKHRPD